MMGFDGLKRKELQALCKKHSIPANLTNVEMAKRLRALVPVEEKAGAMKKTVLKSSDEKGSENDSEVEKRQPKKVRFGLENQMFEFQKSEVKFMGIKGRGGRRKSIFSRENIVDCIHSVVEMKGEKKGVTDCILQKELGSIIDNVASIDSGNVDHRVMTRRSLRNKKVEDDRMGEREDLVDGSDKSVVEIDEEVVETEERDIESLNVQPEKVIRRSKRNAAHVENPKLLPKRASETEVVERAKSRNMIAAKRTNGLEAENDVIIVAKTDLSAGENLKRSKRHFSTEEPLVTLDSLDGQRTIRKEARKQIRMPIKEAKEVLLGGENLRRSRRHASNVEPLFTLDNIVGGRTGRNEARKHKRQPVKVQEEGYAAEIDETVIEESVRSSLLDAHRKKKAAPGLVGRNDPQSEKEIPKQPQTEKAIQNECIKENERSKVLNVVTKDSIHEAVTIKEHCSLYVQLTNPEKECPPVGENLRRSRRNAAKHEFPMILENFVAFTNGKQEAKKRRRGPVNVQEERERSNKPQKEKKRSKNSQKEDETEEPSLEAKDSFPEGAVVEQSNFYIELTIPEHGLSIGEKTRSPSGHGISIIQDGVEGDNHKGLKGSNIQRSESEEPSIEGKDSFPDGVAIEQSSFYVELTIPEQGLPIVEKIRPECPSGHEPSIIRDSVDGDTDKGLEGSNIQRRASVNVQQEESAETGRTLIQEPLQLFGSNAYETGKAAPELLEEIVPQEEKETKELQKIQDKSEIPAVDPSSFPEELSELTTKEHSIKDQLTLYVPLVLTHNADSMVHQNPDEREVIVEDNIYKGEKPEKNSSLESYCRIENSPMEVNTMKQTKQLELVELHSSKSVELMNDSTHSKLGTSPLDMAATPDCASMSIESNKREMVEEHDSFCCSQDKLELGETSEIFTDTDHCTLTNQSGDIDEPEDIQIGQVLSPGEQIPASVLPPEGIIGPLEISISDDVHTGVMNSNKCKEGGEFSSLFATPIAISSAKEETRSYSHEGEVSSDITPVERTISMKNDEHSCLSHMVFSMNEQGEAGRPETSLLDSTHDTQEDSYHSRSGQLDIQLEPTDLLVSDNVFGDDLSPCIERALDLLSCDKIKDDSEMMVLLGSGPKEKQEIDVSIHAHSHRNEVSIKHEQDREKDRIHSAQKNAKLDKIKFENPQCFISKDLPRLGVNYAADIKTSANDQSQVIETAHNTLQHDSLFNNGEQMALLDRVDMVEKSDDDAGREFKALFGQEDDEIKQEGDVAVENTELDTRVVDPHSPICDPSVGLRESDVTFVGNLSTRVETADGAMHCDSVNGAQMMDAAETAHNTLQHDSLFNNGEQMALLDRVDMVEKSDDDAGREFKALFGQEDDEIKQEGDVAVENTELDTRVVDPHSPICDPSVGLRESDVTFVGNLSTRVETADGSMHCDSVNGAQTMDAVETCLEKSPEIHDSDDAGWEHKESTEDNEEKDRVHSTVRNAKLDILETQSCINKLDQELAESSHTVDFYTGLGSANKWCEASIDPLYHEMLLDNAVMMAWLESGKEIIQPTDGDPACSTVYMVSIEQERGEYTDEIYLGMKNADLNIEDLDQKPSNPNDFLEFKECNVADTVEVSSDLKFAENSSLRIEDAGDTLHVDRLPKAATNQGALVEPLAIEVEDTNTAADADCSSQEFRNSVDEVEHDEVKDARDLTEIPIKSTVQEMSSVAAKEGTTEEEKQISADIFFDQVNELKVEGLVSSELKGSDVADTCEYIHLHGNELLFPRIGNTCDSLHLDMATNNGEQPSVLASGGRPADMVAADAKPISKTIIEFDGAALEDEVVSQRKFGLMKCHNVVDHQETEGKAASTTKLKSMSAVRKNLRTILIHGTPNKVQMIGDMKENMASSKLENVGNLTTVRPAKKRTALTDLHKK